MRVSLCARVVRHPPTRNDRDSFGTSGNNPGELLAQRGTSFRTRQRRQVNVCVEWNDRYVQILEYIFKRNGERMAQQRVFGISDIEISSHELVQNVFRHFAVDRQVIIAPRKLSIGTIARYYCKRGYARQ